MSRPRFTPSEAQRETVSALLRCGVALERCCLHVENPATGRPISYKTFGKAFRNEIALAVDCANADVASRLLEIATRPNGRASTVTACIFWLRCRDGWRYADEAPPPA